MAEILKRDDLHFSVEQVQTVVEGVVREGDRTERSALRKLVWYNTL